MANFSSKDSNEEEGAIDISLGGILRCMLCTQPKPNTNDVLLTQLSSQFEMLDEKISLLHAYVHIPSGPKLVFSLNLFFSEQKTK